MASDANTKQLVRSSFLAPQDLLDRFREIAEADHRTVSGELRRLMEQRVAEVEEAA